MAELYGFKEREKKKQKTEKVNKKKSTRKAGLAIVCHHPKRPDSEAGEGNALCHERTSSRKSCAGQYTERNLYA